MTSQEKTELEPIAKRIPVKKHRLFIDELFLCNMNQTRAYHNVYGGGMEAAGNNASRLIANDRITEEIEHRLNENAMSANEVISRLSDQARGDMGDFALVQDSQGVANHPQSHLIKKFKKRRFIPRNEKEDPYEDIELELYDSHAPLVDLGRVHNIFTDKLEVTGKDGGPIQFKEARVELPDED